MKNYNRREFIKKSAITTGGLALGFPVIQANKKNISKNEIINIGIIGTGSEGTFIAEVLKPFANMRVIECCDILPYHLKNGLALAEESAIGCSDYRELLDNKDIDAVVIATPLYLHAKMSIDALEAEKHVYCEKTMAYNIEQTLQMVHAVHSSDKVFQLGHQRRFNTMFQHIKEMLDANFLGTLTNIRCHYDRNGSWRKSVKGHEKDERIINWRMYREYSVGLMAELCAHHIDLVNYLLDNHPITACGIGSLDYWKDGREIFDNVNAIYKYPNGISATFSSLTTNAFSGRKMEFFGTEGTIILSDFGDPEIQKAIYYPEGKLSKEEAAMKGKVDSVTGATEKARIHGEGVPLEFDAGPNRWDMITAFQHFADCIYNGKTPISNVDTGRQAAIAVHMADNAMVNGTVEYWKQEYSA